MCRKNGAGCAKFTAYLYDWFILRNIVRPCGRLGLCKIMAYLRDCPILHNIVRPCGRLGLRGYVGTRGVNTYVGIVYIISLVKKG